jgi:hypothetical protein
MISLIFIFGVKESTMAFLGKIDRHFFWNTFTRRGSQLRTSSFQTTYLKVTSSQHHHHVVGHFIQHINMEATLIPTILCLATLTAAIYLLSPVTIRYIFFAPYIRLRVCVLVTTESVHDLYKSIPPRTGRHLVVHLGDYFVTTVFTLSFLALALPISVLLVAATFIVRLVLCWTIIPLGPTLGKWRRERRDEGRETSVAEWVGLAGSVEMS